LVPEDFRAGARNKKIDSVIVSQYGLVVAGSDKGDIYLWQLNYYEFKKRLPQCFKQLYSFKNHTKNLQCMEFSPNGKFLLTGSVDGTAKVWKLDKGQIEDDKLVVTLE
jgi:WD40 repeat protein